MAELVGVTKRLTDEKPALSNLDKYDEQSTTTAVSDWIDAFKNTSTATAQAAVMTVKVLNETQRRILYFYCLAQVKRDEAAEVIATELEGGGLSETTEASVKGVFQETHELAAALPQKIFFNRSKYIDDDVYFSIDGPQISDAPDLQNRTEGGDEHSASSVPELSNVEEAKDTGSTEMEKLSLTAVDHIASGNSTSAKDVGGPSAGATTGTGRFLSLTPEITFSDGGRGFGSGRQTKLSKHGSSKRSD